MVHFLVDVSIIIESKRMRRKPMEVHRDANTNRKGTALEEDADDVDDICAVGRDGV